MGFDIQAILSQNITLVYDSLDLQTIDTGQLKRLMDTNPIVMDTPDAIVSIYPPDPTIIQIADRRIRITFQRPTESIGSIPLWELAFKSHELAQGKHKLIAYGFNYDVGGALITDREARLVVKDLFFSNPEAIENLLKADISVFIPRLKFKQDETNYDLILEPIDEQNVKIHLNAHFQKDTLPTPSELNESFHEEFEYLRSILSELFKDEDNEDEH